MSDHQDQDAGELNRREVNEMLQTQQRQHEAKFEEVQNQLSSLTSMMARVLKEKGIVEESSAPINTAQEPIILEGAPSQAIHTSVNQHRSVRFNTEEVRNTIPRVAAVENAQTTHQYHQPQVHMPEAMGQTANAPWEYGPGEYEQPYQANINKPLVESIMKPMDMGQFQEEVDKKVKLAMREELRMLKGEDRYGFIDVKQLGLATEIKFPRDFKMPEFTRFNGTTNPIHHLKAYCTKMTVWSRDEEFLLGLFHESLTGPAFDWFMNLEPNEKSDWGDFTHLFVNQYGFNMEVIPTRENLGSMIKGRDESFKQYAMRWMAQAAQVKPPLTNAEKCSYFVGTLGHPYVGAMAGGAYVNFSAVIEAGEHIEYLCKSGKMLSSSTDNKTDNNASSKRSFPPRKNNAEVNQVRNNTTFAKPYNQPSYPATNQQTSYPSVNNQPSYLAVNQQPSHPPINQQTSYSYPPPSPYSFPQTQNLPPPSYAPPPQIHNVSNIPYPWVPVSPYVGNPTPTYPTNNLPPTNIPRPFTEALRDQTFRPRPPRNNRPFPNFNMSRSQLLQFLLANNLTTIKTSRPLTPPYPTWFNTNLTCEYHGGAQGHSIETCLGFRQEVLSLLDQNKIAVGNPAPPNVQGNPLPQHGRQVNAIESDSETVGMDWKDIIFSANQVWLELLKAGYATVAASISEEVEIKCDHQCAYHQTAEHSINSCEGFHLAMRRLSDLGIIEFGRKNSSPKIVNMVDQSDYYLTYPLEVPMISQPILKFSAPTPFYYGNTHAIPWDYTAQVESNTSVGVPMIPRIISTGFTPSELGLIPKGCYDKAKETELSLIPKILDTGANLKPVIPHLLSNKTLGTPLIPQIISTENTPEPPTMRITQTGVMPKALVSEDGKEKLDKAMSTVSLREEKGEQIKDVGGITRAGRCYTPEEIEKARIGKQKVVEVIPINSSNKKDEVDDDEFLKIMKQSEYSITEQLRKTPAKISLYALIMSSDSHRKALQEVLDKAFVRDDITTEKMIGLIDPVKHTNYISFSDDEIPNTSAGNPLALHITLKYKETIIARVLIDGGSSLNVLPLRTFKQLSVDLAEMRSEIMVVKAFDGTSSSTMGSVVLPLKIGPTVFQVELEVMDIQPSYSMLLGRPWIHLAKAVPSTLHQMVKFVSDGQIIKVKGEDNLILTKPSSVPYIDGLENPIENAFHSFEIVKKVENQGCAATEQAESTAKQIMLKQGYQSGLGLGINLQGVRNPISIKACPRNQGIGYDDFPETSEGKEAEIPYLKKFIPSHQIAVIEDSKLNIEESEPSLIANADLCNWESELIPEVWSFM